MADGFEWMWLGVVPALFGWLLTIAFGVLGATSVRRVDPRAGWMIVVAASIEILLGVASVAVPGLLLRTHGVEEASRSIAFWGVLSATLGLVGRGLLFAAIVSLVAGRARRPREEPHVV